MNCWKVAWAADRAMRSKLDIIAMIGLGMPGPLVELAAPWPSSEPGLLDGARAA